MPTLPYVKQTVQDRSSGALALGSDLHVKIGVSSLGTHNLFEIFTDPDALTTARGVGPVVSAAAHHISVTGQPCAVIRIDPAQVTAGTLGAITKVGGHAGPTISDSSSAPLDSGDLLVEIVLGGAVATATFRYSLDGGETWSATILTAATVALTGTGITLAFAAGTYVAGNQYSATATGPTYNATGMGTAITAALSATQRFRLIHLVGYAATASAMAALVASANTQLEGAAASQYRYTRIFFDGAPEADNAQITAFASVAARRAGYGAGTAELYHPYSGGNITRPMMWAEVARMMQVRISVDPGRVADGPLGGVFSIARDEYKTPALNAARINSLRTYVGRIGFFVSQGLLLAPDGSDFATTARGFVMDAACAIAYDALLNYVNQNVLVNASNGRVTELEAQAIEAYVTTKLRDQLADIDCQDVDFVVDRNVNTLTTEILRGKTRILPFGVARYIENTLSFISPTSSLVQGA